MNENMNLSIFKREYSQEVISLFTDVFSASEGENEGTVIGQLVSDLIETTQQNELFGFVAQTPNKIVGSIFFSRFSLPSNQLAFLLSPLAIATDQQGNGIGQALIKHGIKQLKPEGVEFIFTYGDPEFYSKVGFTHLSENTVRAPFKLKYPEGWLVQSLNNSTIEAMEGKTACVEAFNNQQLW